MTEQAIALDEDAVRAGNKMHALARRLWPICRSITGNGVRETLGIIREQLPAMRIIEVPTGTKCFDWTIPNEWNIRGARLIGPDGQTVVDFKDSNLHVLSYSRPIDAEVSLDELQSHLHSIPDQPDATPYVTSYYKEEWGFCLPHRVREGLKPGTYRAFIDSTLAPGSLTYGELRLPGSTDREVLLSTYVCHPSMANNELSGPVLGAALASWLSSCDRRLSYRIIFVPETIGAIAYLSSNVEEMKRLTIAGFVLTCVGDERAWSYMPSRAGNTLADRAALHALRHLAPDYDGYSFLQRGSDERQYCSPGIDLPVCSVMRSKYDTFPEYHTSLDDLSLVTPAGLAGSFTMHRRMLEALEANCIPRAIVLGEPKMSDRGLRPTTGRRGSASSSRTMMNLLAYADGERDLLAIADVIGVPAWDLPATAEQLSEVELLKLDFGISDGLMGTLSTGEVYDAYDCVIRRAEAWLELRVPSIAGFRVSSLRQRLAQRLIELTFEEALVKIGKTGGHGGQVSSKGVTIDTASGDVSISPVLWFESVGSFLLRWGYLLVQFAASIARSSPRKAIPATVVWDPQPADEAARKRFAAFCREGPISPLREAQTLFVRTTAKKAIREDIATIFSGQPLVDLVRTNLSRGDRAMLLLDHIAIAFRYLWWSVRMPLLAVLGRDVDYLAAIALLDRRGALEAFVTTTAGFAVQPIWVEGRTNQRFQHHMIWYSQNFIPKSYKGETRRYDLVQSRHMRVHCHWVWTEGFRDYLRGLGQTGEINVVGPILLYQEGEVGSLRPGQGIAAFDITPVVPTYAVFGAAKNYYSLATMTKFVADISSAARQLAEETREPITVYLKQKRSPKAGIHETEYWTAIDEIAEVNGNLVLMPPDTNVFGLVDRCAVTLSVPYTSTAYVATARDKPSAYYDPFAELEAMYERHPLLEFVTEREQLELFLRKHMRREPAILTSGER